MLKKFVKKVKSTVCAVKTVVACQKAEGYVDTGVKILISVVVGALLLSALYALFNTTIMPTVADKITQLFNFAG